MRELDLREIQLAELDILKEFDAICRKNGLCYSLAFGTLLGAVRHGGFIPWDDDVDVMMPRPDYEKFREIALKELTGRYVITDDRGKKGEYPFIKMLDNSVIVARDNFKWEVDRLWLDVFPIDGIASDFAERKKRSGKLAKLRKSITRVKILENPATFGQKLASAVYRLGVSLFWNRRTLFSKLHREIARYPYETSEYVSDPACDMCGYGVFASALPPESYYKTVEMNFEGCAFSAIERWKDHLKSFYGDYMSLPPEEKRISHGLKAYIKEE